MRRDPPRVAARNRRLVTSVGCISKRKLDSEQCSRWRDFARLSTTGYRETAPLSLHLGIGVELNPVEAFIESDPIFIKSTYVRTLRAAVRLLLFV